MLRSLISALALLTPAGLLAQIDDSAIVISGVVDAIGGGSGLKAQGDESWTGSFHLVAWRLEGSAKIEERVLRVQIPDQTQQSLKNWEAIFPPRTMVRFSIREPVRPGEYRDLAVLRALLKAKPDPKLEAIAYEILNPAPYTDPIFGVFTPSEYFPEHFERKHQWLGQSVTLSLTLDADGPQTPESAAQCSQHLHALWETREQWDARIRAAIAEEYYETWVNGWRKEHEPVISPQEFASRFTLENVSVSPSGGFSMMFGDDDLFWGHGMSVDYFPEDDSLGVALFG